MQARRLSVGLISVLALLVPTTSATAQDTGTKNPANAIADQVDRATPSESQDTPMPTRQDHDGFQASTQDLLRFPKESTGPVEVQRPDVPSLLVGLPSDGTARPGIQAPDGTIAYPDSLPATDVAGQAFADSMRLHTVMKNPQAPEEMHYRLGLPAGSRLVQDEHGRVNILDRDGRFLAGAGSPWAHDRTGRSLPTHYEIRGADLVQVVDHHRPDIAYPVVADPWLGFDIIDSARWTRPDPSEPQHWSLYAQPTTWARVNGGGYFPGASGWDELYDKYRNQGRGIKKNIGGLRDQYICHHQFAFLRSGPYHLDEWLPDVSYPETVRQQCNPGM